jgi:type III secretion protein V
MLAARSDLAVAILLVAVLFMIILPLPTQLVDALIAFNLCSAAVLLMVAVYIPTPVKFAAFPSVLLLSTLFRLALAISTTRLILLQADAGQIIQTFGEFVVGGNLVVGLVVFLIITVVQFVVITKGAERVAEVAARFSLDAMPGKQMSIDSDMRSGLIDMVQARERRRMLERESQLYGSMDGAMKFVKGDAIAGLLIIFINIIGGIAIGTLQRGLDLDQALEIYSILTIGDGLVQQIPGLFVSVTAGIVVTRVADDDSSNLGGDIASQIGAQPKALMVAGGILGGFAMVPGFPTLTFIALGVLVGGGGYLAYRRATRPAPTRGKGALPAVRASTEAEASGEGNGESEFSITVPLMVDVATDVEDAISPDLLNEELARVRRALYYDLGVPFPGIHLRFNAQLPPSSYQILVEEVPVSQGQLRAGSLFVRETAEHLDMLGVPYEQADPFLPRLATIWVSSEHREQLTATGIAFMEGSSVLTYHLSFVLRKYAAEFLGIQETRFLLAQMEGSFGELVKEVQRLLPLQKIAEILQRLVSESISIRNLRAVAGVGAEGKGRGPFDRVRAQPSEALRQLQILRRPQHSRVLPAHPRRRGHDPQRDPADLERQLSGARSGDRAPLHRRRQGGGRRRLGAHAGTGIAGLDGYPPLYPKVDRRRDVRSAGAVLSGTDAGDHDSTIGTHRAVACPTTSARGGGPAFPPCIEERGIRFPLRAPSEGGVGGDRSMVDGDRLSITLVMVGVGPRREADDVCAGGRQRLARRDRQRGRHAAQAEPRGGLCAGVR